MAEQHEMLEDCSKRIEKLNEYEATFIRDVKNQTVWGRRLSEKQLSYLEEVWEKATKDG